MKNTNLPYLNFKTLIKSFVLLVLCLSMFNGCATQKPDLRVAFYAFEYEGENYRIRSISSKEDTISCNELISDRFVAKDYDQDRFIDEISLGEINLAEAQKIYYYALKLLSMENKLREVSTQNNRFIYNNFEFVYEIKSFNPADSEPFNEFKVIHNRHITNPKIIISIDKKADGTIDEIQDGSISLEKIQSLYAHAIKKGLKKEELVEVDSMILVKAK
jgi:hypothetical protein